RLPARAADSRTLARDSGGAGDRLCRAAAGRQRRAAETLQALLAGRPRPDARAQHPSGRLVGGREDGVDPLRDRGGPGVDEIEPVATMHLLMRGAEALGLLEADAAGRGVFDEAELLDEEDAALEPAGVGEPHRGVAEF